MISRSVVFLIGIVCIIGWMTGPVLADDTAVLPGEPDATILPAPIPTHLPGGEGISYYDVYTNVDGGASISFDKEFQGVTAGGLLTVPVHTTQRRIRWSPRQRPGIIQHNGPCRRSRRKGSTRPST
ncbi:hypothetical protein [Methanogenium cariaci]|uniref:hypothetical protein n=1 Tax=Methanogenium cariaci TaxID=2197 RepID=UPI00155D9DCE|nr:hypothetical protein [Methanogenium cariaci]